MRIIAGKYKGKKLFAPEGVEVRPTSDRARESVFNILLNKLDNPISDYKIIDLFAGTGAFALEALSRGVSKACMVELSKKSIFCINKNIENLGDVKDKVKIINQDASKLSYNNGEKYNLVFIDAPYNKSLSEPALTSLLKNNWLDSNSIIIVEISKSEGFNIPDGVSVIDERIYGKAKFIFLKNLA
jgi:16S rRNA (guanine966-N2)-methyltransferase